MQSLFELYDEQSNHCILEGTNYREILLYCVLGFVNCRELESLQEIEISMLQSVLFRYYPIHLVTPLSILEISPTKVILHSGVKMEKEEGTK